MTRTREAVTFISPIRRPAMVQSTRRHRAVVFVSHVEAVWFQPGSARGSISFGRPACVITFDKRGTGLSDRVKRVACARRAHSTTSGSDLHASAGCNGQPCVWSVSELGLLATLSAGRLLSHPLPGPDTSMARSCAGFWWPPSSRSSSAISSDTGPLVPAHAGFARPRGE